MSDAAAGQLVFAQSVPCLHCGYDLRNIRVSGVCPECGKAAGDALHGVAAARADDVEEVRSGLRILQASSIGGPVIAAGMISMLAFGRASSNPESMLVCAGIVGCIGLPALTLAGMNLLVKPLRARTPPISPPPRGEWAMGKSLRRLAVWHMIVSAIWFVCMLVVTNSRLDAREEVVVFMVFALLWTMGMLWTGKNALACVRMSEIAGRSNGSRVSAWMMVMAWIAGVMMLGVVAAGAFALEMFMLETLARNARVYYLRQHVRGAFGAMEMIAPVVYLGSLGCWAVAWPISIAFVRRRVGRAARAEGAAEGPLVKRAESEPREPVGAAPAQGQNPQAPSPPVL